jgi:hypothetical protein
MRLGRVELAWASVVPPQIRARAWPVALRDGELVVHVRDSQWLHELMYLRQDLLARLCASRPDLGIFSLRLRLGPIRALDEGAEPAAAAPAPVGSLACEPSADTLRALEEIRDPELRSRAAAARVGLGRR